MKINGRLDFDASSASEITNLRVQKYANFAAVPAWTASDVGRMVYAITQETLYYGDADGWVPLATGGNAYPQADGDALEASLGAGVTSTGVFVPGAFDSPIAGATSFTNAINQLAAYATGNNTLFEMDDVTLTQAVPTGPKFLYTSGANWFDKTLVTADVSDLTVSAAQINNAAATTSSTAELNLLDGATVVTADLNLLTGLAAFGVTTVELQFVDGVTSNIQTQLNNKQPLDATLTALAAFSATGIVVSNGADSFFGRALVAPAEGFTISDANGVAGNPTFALADDLAGLEGLSTTGYAVRTGASTWTTRQINGFAGRTVVTNGNGVGSNTDVDLDTVTDAGTGTFLKFTRDTYGRVSGTTAVVAADITGLVSAIYVDVAGDTMTGNLAMGTNYVTMNNVPTLDTQAANKAYVDSIAAGLSWKQATDAATVTPIAGVYANGAAGVGATIAVGGTALTVDGVVLANGNRVLVKDQPGGGIAALDGLVGGTGYTNGTFLGVALTGGTGNSATADIVVAGGIVTSVTLVSVGSSFTDNDTLSAALAGGAGFTVDVNTTTQRAHNGIYVVSGVGAGPVVLTRGTNIDQPGEFLGATVFVGDGAVNDNSGWTQTESVTTVGTTSVVWVQFSGASTYIWGDGLGNSGNTIFVKMGAGIQILPSDEVGLDIESNKAIQLTGTGLLTGDQLTLVLASGSGLAQSASGLTINAASVTNAMLVNNSISFNSDTGTAVQALGSTFLISGEIGQGVSTSITGSTLEINVANASTSAKGVAQFAAADFDVTAGVVTINSIGNSQLDNSSIGFAGTAGGTFQRALGTTLTINGGSAPVTTDSSVTGTVTINVADATTAAKGLASFNSSHFSVTSGAVDLAASLDDLTNVSSADSAATGDLLTKTAGDWQNVTRADVVGSTSVDAHNDVTISGAAAGQTLVYIGSQWVNRKVFHTETFGSATTWTVNHGLGQKFCNVTIADAGDEVVIPQSITFVSTTQLVVTFNTAIAGQVMVSGIAAV